jgi:hypothetical protein
MELKVAAVTYKKMASESCEVTMAFKFLHLLSLSSLFNRGGDSMQADT